MRCSPLREARRAAAAVLLLAAGCARPPLALPAIDGDPLAVLRARGAAIATLRARFSAVAYVGGEERRASGVLLARHPDALRLRLIAPFGLTVLDYTRTADEAAVWLPEARADAPADVALFGHLGVDDALPPASCRAEPADGPLAVYRCPLAPAGERLLGLDPTTATLRVARDWVEGRLVLTRTYDDYRLVGGVPLPFRLSLHAENATVEVRIDAYELNPRLAADAFVPPPDARPLTPGS